MRMACQAIRIRKRAVGKLTPMRITVASATVVRLASRVACSISDGAGLFRSVSWVALSARQPVVGTVEWKSGQSVEFSIDTGPWTAERLVRTGMTILTRGSGRGPPVLGRGAHKRLGMRRLVTRLASAYVGDWLVGTARLHQALYGMVRVGRMAVPARRLAMGAFQQKSVCMLEPGRTSEGDLLAVT